MNPNPSSPPLTYFPAYLGLFASLFLAAVCNTFLDIQYGGFSFESIFWAVIFGVTVRIGWLQRGEVGDDGRMGQKVVFILGAILTLIVFIPMWGFPRAGLAMLAMLQASQNCVTVTRRHLHMGLLVSAVMVMFAASHHRADWTMLFYLVPYVTAVVFTLVAEQISRRAQDVRRDSLGSGSAKGQGIAIVAATSAILIGGGLLYAVTPQITWPYLSWKFGQPGSLATLGKSTGQSPVGGQGDGSGNLSGGYAGSGGKPEEGGEALLLRPGGWPSAQTMREAAKRKGMPEWQSSAIRQMADWVEATEFIVTPIKLGLDELWNDLKDWLKKQRQEIIIFLMALIVSSIVVAAWLLLKEARLGVWLRSRLDYLLLGLLGRHVPGNAGARQYYAALQRLLDLQDLARPQSANTQEYLALVGRRYEHLRREVAEITLFFEWARYGEREVTASELARMHDCYLGMFRGLELLSS